jgi:dihydrofolate synthase/folylpolyglutamate synthase
VDGRDVLLDGAHNPAGAAALARALDDLQPFLTDGPMTLITAAMADKDVGGVISALVGVRALAGATVVCTTVAVPRAMAAAELAGHWRTQRREGAIVVEPELRMALQRVLDGMVGGSGPVVVAGSLYLVGAVRRQLLGDPDLHDPEGPEEA